MPTHSPYLIREGVRILVVTLLTGLSVFSTYGQGSKPRIAVIGSSTAYGYFGGLYPRDSGFVFKLEKYYQTLGLIDAIDNYAMTATDCYTGMPTGYIPPVGRNQPDPHYNITTAINAEHKPDVVLVNYPSNSYESMSDEEIIFCLDSIRKYANDRGVRCYITTSQPRDDWWTYQDAEDGLCRLKHIKDLILNYFGEFAIDFYTGLAADDCKREADYALEDDFYHLNPAGHTILENRVIAKNILLGPLPITFLDFKANSDLGKVNLEWRINADMPVRFFSVLRSKDGSIFKEIAKVSCPGGDLFGFTDQMAADGSYFYKIEGIEATGQKYASKVLAVKISHSKLNISRVYLNSNSLRVEFISTAENPVIFSLINMNGQIIFKEKQYPTSGIFEKNISYLHPGIYMLAIYNGSDLVVRKVVRH